MLEVEQFIADCRAALDGDRASRNVREIVARTVSDPAGVARAFGEPAKGGLNIVHRSPELTILNVVWPAGQIVMPHNHQLWAVIGVYTGREDNILWRRTSDGEMVEAAGAKTLGVKDSIAFGADVIHSVVNPLGRLTGALHVYGGDFFAVPRSEWDPETLLERPYDVEKAMRMFNRP